MKITTHELAAELDGFGRHRIEIVTELAHDGAPDGIGPALLFAIGSRETGLRNIVGDFGHGRGWLQVDDRFHQDWLATHRGCADGSFTPTFDSSLAKGRVPTLTAATLFAIEQLRENTQSAVHSGVPQAQALRFAVAAYNAGATGALKGFRAGNVDQRTAHHDYSADVLERARAIAGLLKPVIV